MYHPPITTYLFFGPSIDTMTTFTTKEQFLAKYKTTADECDCLARGYSLPIDNYSCKHMKVFRGELEFGQHLVSKPRAPKYVKTKWASAIAQHRAETFGIAYEDIKKYLVEIGQWYGPIYNDQINTYVNRLKYVTKSYSCSCYHHENTGEPCKHMIRLGKLKKIEREKSLKEATGCDFLDKVEKSIKLAKEEIELERKNFLQEKEEFREKLGLCCICYETNTIDVGCCKAKMCIGCWDKIEINVNRKPTCPLCREKLPQLTTILIDKFNNILK